MFLIKKISDQYDPPFLFFSFFAEFPKMVSSGLKKSALAGILVGAIVAAIAVSVVATICIMKKHTKRRTISRRSCKPSFFFFSLKK
jgi:Na+/phosphate symporter